MAPKKLPDEISRNGVSAFAKSLMVKDGTIQVDLQWAGLDDDDMARWCEWAAAFGLRELLQTGQVARAANSSLLASEVNVSENKLGDKGLHSLLSFLWGQRVGVQVLKLSGNQIGRAGASALADWIMSSPVPLLELDLSENFLCSEGAFDILSAFGCGEHYPPQWPRSRGEGHRPAPVWFNVAGNCVAEAAALLQGAEEQMQSLQEKVAKPPGGAKAEGQAPPMLCVVAEGSRCRAGRCARHSPCPLVHVAGSTQQRTADSEVPLVASCWNEDEESEEEEERWRVSTSQAELVTAAPVPRTAPQLPGRVPVAPVLRSPPPAAEERSPKEPAIQPAAPALPPPPPPATAAQPVLGRPKAASRSKAPALLVGYLTKDAALPPPPSRPPPPGPALREPEGQLRQLLTRHKDPKAARRLRWSQTQETIPEDEEEAVEEEGEEGESDSDDHADSKVSEEQPSSEGQEEPEAPSVDEREEPPQVSLPTPPAPVAADGVQKPSSAGLSFLSPAPSEADLGSRLQPLSTGSLPTSYDSPTAGRKKWTREDEVAARKAAGCTLRGIFGAVGGSSELLPSNMASGHSERPADATCPSSSPAASTGSGSGSTTASSSSTVKGKLSLWGEDEETSSSSSLQGAAKAAADSAPPVSRTSSGGSCSEASSRTAISVRSEPMQGDARAPPDLLRVSSGATTSATTDTDEDKGEDAWAVWKAKKMGLQVRHETRRGEVRKQDVRRCTSPGDYAQSRSPSPRRPSPGRAREGLSPKPRRVSPSARRDLWPELTAAQQRQTELLNDPWTKFRMAHMSQDSRPPWEISQPHQRRDRGGGMYRDYREMPIGSGMPSETGHGYPRRERGGGGYRDFRDYSEMPSAGERLPIEGLFTGTLKFWEDAGPGKGWVESDRRIPHESFRSGSLIFLAARDLPRGAHEGCRLRFRVYLDQQGFGAFRCQVLDGTKLVMGGRLGGPQLVDPFAPVW